MFNLSIPKPTLLLPVLLLAIVGCGDSRVSETQSDETQSPTVTQATSSQPGAPQADTMTQELTADSTAQEVCERFMLLLQSGDRIGAEGLLSRRARKMITEVGLTLDLGTPGTALTVGEAAYATNRAKVAQVTCKLGSGDSETEMTWMLRKPKQGWRITGLIVSGPQGQDLRSLESRSDVAAIQKAMGGSPASAVKNVPEVRQVSAIEELK